MIMKNLREISGGLIAVDKNGNIAMPFYTAGMYRSYIEICGKMVVEIYKLRKEEYLTLIMLFSNKMP